MPLDPTGEIFGLVDCSIALVALGKFDVMLRERIQRPADTTATGNLIVQIEVQEILEDAEWLGNRYEALGSVVDGLQQAIPGRPEAATQFKIAMSRLSSLLASKASLFKTAAG